MMLTRQKTERLRGQFGIQQQDFRGGRAGERNDDVAARRGFMQANVKRVVFLFIRQFIIKEAVPTVTPYLPGQ